MNPSTPYKPWRQLRRLALLLLVAAMTLPVNAAAAKHRKKKPTKVATHQNAVPGPSYSQRVDALQAADDIAQRQHLDRDWVRRTRDRGSG